MRLLTKEQSRELDRRAQDEFGISDQELMGNAGQKIAEAVVKHLADQHDPCIGIICGKGNNGGDGFAAAAILKSKGFRVHLFYLGDESSLSGAPRHYYEQCIQQGLAVDFYTNLPDELPEFNLVIDCLLGTGFKAPLREVMVPWVQWINSLDADVVSADIPSGVEANTGRLDPVAVHADLTVTMGLGKLGLYLEPGKSHAGIIQVVDIGFPEIDKLDGRQWHLTTEQNVHSWLKPLQSRTHKHAQGKVLLVAGSTGMTGAAYLATMGALRSGAGLAVACAPASLDSIYEIKITEGMTVPCEDEGQGYLSVNHYPVIEDWFDWCDAIVIGPGLGQAEGTRELVKKLIRSAPKPLILDADGLRAAYEDPTILNAAQYPVVLTPHYGEFSRLVNLSPDKIQQNLVATIDRFLEKINCILVLKNAPTCLAWNHTGFVNSSGNPGLATGGTGDVLSGVIGGLLAQGHEPEKAAVLGVYLHGKAADEVAVEKGQRGLLASDLLSHIPSVLKAYE
jgi:NAD(P)H-hydrate epimerase